MRASSTATTTCHAAVSPVVRSFAFSSRRSLQTAPLKVQRTVRRETRRQVVHAESGSNLDMLQPGMAFKQAEAWAEKNRRGITAAINGTAVAMVLLGASYKLFEVDLEISRGWTWFEFLVNTAQDDFLGYEHAVSIHPVITKAITSGVAYTLGDFAAQTFQGRNILNMDLSRSLRSGAAGFCIHGPFCHFWLQWMEMNLSFGGAWWAVFPKVVADQTVWSIFLNTMYTSTILALNMKSPAFILEELKATAWPALSSGWRFWPFVHCISFSPFIPQDLKLLFIDTMEIIWVTILATVVNRPAEGEPVLVCSIEAGTEASKPDVNIALQSQVQASLPQFEDEDGQLREILLNTMDMEELAEMAKQAEEMNFREDMPKEEIEEIAARLGISEEMLLTLSVSMSMDYDKEVEEKRAEQDEEVMRVNGVEKRESSMEEARHN